MNLRNSNCGSHSTTDRPERVANQAYRLSDEDIFRLANAVAARISAQLATNAPAVLTHRLSVAQFARCVERSEEHVRRQIRARLIPTADHDGRPYLIHPRALKHFGVTPELAAARLANWENSSEHKQRGQIAA